MGLVSVSKLFSTIYDYTKNHIDIMYPSWDKYYNAKKSKKYTEALIMRGANVKLSGVISIL